MGDPMTDAKKRGRQEQRDITFPQGEREPLDAVIATHTRQANQSLNPESFPSGNPKLSRRAREQESHSGGQA